MQVECKFLFMRELEKKLGLHLKGLRVARGWSQEEMSHRAGCSTYTVSNVERGKVLPTMHIILAYRKAFDIDIVDVLAPLSEQKAGTELEYWETELLSIAKGLSPENRKVAMKQMMALIE